MPPPDPSSLSGFLFPMPASRERKPDFSALPDFFREKIAGFFGEKIINGEICHGSLSASAGFILSLSSGRKVFAKGNHPEETAHGAQNLRDEIFAYERLPVLKKIAPAYLGCLDAGDEDGWMLGFWDYIQESSPPDFSRLYQTMANYMQCGENPFCLKAAQEKNYISLFFTPERKWKRLRNDLRVQGEFLHLFEDEAWAAGWLGNNLKNLITLQEQLPALLTEKQGLIHGDLRLDNILFGAQVFIIDWPNACLGPAGFDLLFLFASLESQGLGRIETHLAAFSALTGLEYTRMSYLIVAAGIAGFFAEQAFRVVPEKMPRLRWMQKSLLLSLLLFLARQGVLEQIPLFRGQNIE